MNLESVADKIRRKLTAAFKPALLEVIDESAKHAGHAGHRPGGESHFHVRIVSEVFAGQNKVARHRAVYQALAEEMQGPIHALSLDIATAQESQIV